MYNFYKYYLIFSSFFNLFDFKTFIYYQLNGSLIDKHEMNFTIFITNFSGVVIYSLDTYYNKFLMELEKGETSRKILFKFNEFHLNSDSIKLCGCRKCEGILMTIVLRLKHSRVYIDCNNNKGLVSFSGNLKWPDQFSGYPIPINFQNSTNRTFIWMGNIGPYQGYKDVYSLPLKNQLMGCMRSIYFGNELVEESKNECKCFTDIKPSHICSFLKLDYSSDIEYTFENRIKLYPSQSHNYNTNDIEKFGFPIKIEWDSDIQNKNKNKNFSLIKLLFDNKSSIFVQINNYSQVTIIMEKFGLIQCSQKLFLAENYLTKSIIIDFSTNKLKIYINDSKPHNMVEDEIFLKPIEINIGNNQSSEEPINRTITFHYKWKYFMTTQSPDQNYPPESAAYETWIFIIVGCLIFLLLFFLTLKLRPAFYCKFSKMHTESNCSGKRHVNTQNISLPITDTEIYDVIT